MKILVYGFYNNSNLGDNLFIEAFRHLFPDFDFIFTETIAEDKLRGIDAVFFGGGSFLLARPLISEESLQELRHKKIFYLGVGVEAEIHPVHLDLMRSAKMIATRSPEQIKKLSFFNKNVSYVPDLVYSLQDQVVHSEKINNSVLILPNISIIPQVADAHWKHSAWAYFKSEFVQFMDWLIDNGYHPHLFPMCQGQEIDDNWVSAELVSYMEKRNSRYIHSSVDRPISIKEITKLVSQYNIVITQRFHGIVLSEMTRTPYLTISHHDKLKFSQPGEGYFLSYYNTSKQLLISLFEKTLKMKFSAALPIESDTFEIFSKEVTSQLI